MGKTPLGRKAWNLLLLALLWARKGGVFKRGMMMDRLLPSYIKSLRHNPAHRPESIHYRERELSLHDTPIFHFKMLRPSSMRFHIPCLNSPSVDFDFDFQDDLLYNNHPDGNGHSRRSFLTRGNEREDEHFDDCDSGDNGRRSSCWEEALEEDGRIDLKAEEFIAKFYEQTKLQRQISYLQYHDMLNRGTS